MFLFEWPILLAASCAGAILCVAFADSGVPSIEWPLVYRSGWHRTSRGQVTPLPEGRIRAADAHYGANGDVIAVGAAGGPAESPLGELGGGEWWIDRRSGQATLLNNMYRGELFWGASLRTISDVLPSPDGTRWVGRRKVLDNSARAVVLDQPDRDEVLRRALVSSTWELTDVASGQTKVLMDFRKTPPSLRPRDEVWVDDRRLAYIRCPDTGLPAERQLNELCTLDVDTGEVRIVGVVEPSGGYKLHRVSPGRLAYYVQSAEVQAALREYWDAHTRVPREVEIERRLVPAGWSLVIVHVRADEVTQHTIKMPNPAPPLGLVSPNERFVAFHTGIPGRTGGPGVTEPWYCLAIGNLATGRVVRLDNESSKLCEWHPDGTKLLAVITAEEPTDPPGVIVEIPVADICRSLEGDGQQ